MEKTNFKKLVSLSLAAMLCASVPAISANGAFATDGAPAGDGEPVPVEDNSFVVEETAAIRVSDPAGMRFYANIGADLVDDVQSADEFGFLIFPHAYLAEDENAGKADWQVKGIDGNAEYGLWDYVKVSTTEMDGLIYQRETDGKYCVNGVLHTVVDADMEFSAIAYYVKDGEPVYADFNEDFSRSLSYVAKWAYISEPAKRNAIKSTFDWLNTDEFTINSGKEMQMLSNAVSEENPCADLSFTLAKTIAVGSDYTPVPAAFAGEWSWNSSAIIMVDNENELAFAGTYSWNKTAALVSSAYYRNGAISRSSKLIDATTATIRAKIGGETNTKTTDVIQNLDESTPYTGTSAYFTATTAGAQVKDYYSVSTNWYLPKASENTYRELNAAKELYSGITFRFYVDYAASDASKQVWNGSETDGVLALTGYNNRQESPMPKGQWIEVTYTIDQIMDVSINRTTNYATEYNYLPLGYLYFRPINSSGNFYIGDCVFVK